MRIISGQWRSRPLDAPPGPGTRPTADRARETLFSMLVSRIGSFEGLSILDLFAGSGALSLEALSRGAARAFLVERDRAAREAITVNVARFAASAELVGNDATALPLARAACDIIFLDPPYGEALAAPALASALARGWVAPGAWISVETGLKEGVEAPGFALETTRTVGKAALHLLRPS